MEHLLKLYAAVVRRRRGGIAQGHDGASPEQHSSADATPAELQRLPRRPEILYLARNQFLGNASSDIITIKPRKLSKLSALGGRRGSLAAASSTAAKSGQRSELLDHFLTLPPELQLKVLSYLDFSDLERLRRTCRFFRTRVSPRLVRTLLAPHFRYHIRHTCHICLRQYDDPKTLINSWPVCGVEIPLSNICVECVWSGKGFDVGRKYLLADNALVFVCRWCGRPVASEPAWNQPEFHKRCFKRYTQAVFLYYQMGIAQWVVVFIASGLCWHYFRSRLPWVLGVVAAGFVVTLWNFCLNALRGTILRTYHIGLILEALIFASWTVPLVELFRINSQQIPLRAMDSYEKATVVFIMFNLVSRGINIIGNAILMCEYKLWRHKKPCMSPARSAWIHALEVFIFYVEPQCVEQEYPARWWFRRRPSGGGRDVDSFGQLHLIANTPAPIQGV